MATGRWRCSVSFLSSSSPSNGAQSDCSEIFLSLGRFNSAALWTRCWLCGSWFQSSGLMIFNCFSKRGGAFCLIGWWQIWFVLCQWWFFRYRQEKPWACLELCVILSTLEALIQRFLFPNQELPVVFMRVCFVWIQYLLEDHFTSFTEAEN